MLDKPLARAAQSGKPVQLIGSILGILNGKVGDRLCLDCRHESPAYLTNQIVGQLASLRCSRFPLRHAALLKFNLEPNCSMPQEGTYFLNLLFMQENNLFLKIIITCFTRNKLFQNNLFCPNFKKQLIYQEITYLA